MDENMENQSPEQEEKPQPETPPRPETPPTGPISQDSRNMAMLCHLLGFFTSFVGPLILWLIKKEEDKFVDEQGKEALNFQITVLLAGIVSGLLSVVCIGILLAIAVGVGDLIFSILACVATSKGEHYRYPVSLRLVK